jgi:hypothetical protein
MSLAGKNRNTRRTNTSHSKKGYFDQLNKYKLLKEKSVRTLVENQYLVCRSVKKTSHQITNKNTRSIIGL